MHIRIIGASEAITEFPPQSEVYTGTFYLYMHIRIIGASEAITEFPPQSEVYTGTFYLYMHIRIIGASEAITEFPPQSEVYTGTFYLYMHIRIAPLVGLCGSSVPHYIGVLELASYPGLPSQFLCEGRPGNEAKQTWGRLVSRARPSHPWSRVWSACATVAVPAECN